MMKPSLTLRVLATVILLCAASACGGGDAPPPIDATALDATDVDAPAINRCELLCACTRDFCSDAFAACLTQCAGLEVSVRECRIEHCGYAMTNPGVHCPHTRGEGLCME